VECYRRPDVDRTACVGVPYTDEMIENAEAD
jgi:cbb3-type cytochrome oxidase cytochrome c subunit